jgi:2-dehydropantoate 2-reductase
MIKTCLVAGAGAIGLQVAERIYRANPGCLSLLAKGARLDRYRKNGLAVNGEKIPFRLTDGEGASPSDLIIVACKGYHLDQVIRDMRPFVGLQTIIVSLLNGVSSEEEIGRVYGREKLPLAMILGTDALKGDCAVTFATRGVIHYGDASGRNGSREERLAEFFGAAGVPCELREDMLRQYWYKFMINVGINQASAVLRLPYRAFQTNGQPGEKAEARELMEKAMREVIAVAAALPDAPGIDEGDIARWYGTLNPLNPEGYTSMAQDVLAGRKTEVDLFAIEMMKRGRRYGVPVPLNETFSLMLKAIEQA